MYVTVVLLELADQSKMEAPHIKNPGSQVERPTSERKKIMLFYPILILIPSLISSSFEPKIKTVYSPETAQAVVTEATNFLKEVLDIHLRVLNIKPSQDADEKKELNGKKENLERDLACYTEKTLVKSGTVPTLDRIKIIAAESRNHLVHEIGVTEKSIKDYETAKALFVADPTDIKRDNTASALDEVRDNLNARMVEYFNHQMIFYKVLLDYATSALPGNTETIQELLKYMNDENMRGYNEDSAGRIHAILDFSMKYIKDHSAEPFVKPAETPEVANPGNPADKSEKEEVIPDGSARMSTPKKILIGTFVLAILSAIIMLVYLFVLKEEDVYKSE